MTEWGISQEWEIDLAWQSMHAKQCMHTWNHTIILIDAGKVLDKMKHLFTIKTLNKLINEFSSGSLKQWSHLENSLAIPWKVKANSTTRYILKRMKHVCPHKNLYTNVHSSDIYNSQKVETPNTHQLTNGYIKCDVSVQWDVCHLAIRRNEVWMHATTEMSLENRMMLSERNQTQTLHVTWHLYEMSGLGKSVKTVVYRAGVEDGEGLLTSMDFLSGVVKLVELDSSH